MSRYYEEALADITSATANAASADVSSMEKLMLAISGTFVGTVQAEVSVDGTKFSKYGTALTAPGVVEIASPCKKVRANCTAYTSGTIESRLSGVDQN